jgi:hypothetical protein
MSTNLHFLFVLAASHLLVESPQSDWLEQQESQQYCSVRLYLTELALFFPFSSFSSPPGKLSFK